MICSDGSIEEEFKKATKFFLKNMYPEDMISSNIRSTRSKFNTSKMLDSPRSTVYEKPPWIEPASKVFSDKISLSIYIYIYIYIYETGGSWSGVIVSNLVKQVITRKFKSDCMHGTCTQQILYLLMNQL